jgi:hypothetical protein
MKDCDSRRSWIGGEGISSRDKYRSRRRENMGNHKKICHIREPQQLYGVVHRSQASQGTYVCMIQCRKVCMYMGDNEDRDIQVLRSESTRSYNQGGDSRIAGVIYSFLNFSMGHFPRFGRPCKL